MDAMPPLTGRSLRILAALVREYIETGEPVGSHALVRAGGFEVSPATMRNELARLESLGYVHQPHTSAGRVPSDLGYRAYVDLLLQSRPARRRTAPALEADLRERAGGAALMDDVLSYVSHVVSQASRHVGFALGPLHQGAAFHQIEFVKLAGSAVLAVIVARGGQVCQRVVDLGHDLGATHLAEAASYLNGRFAGLTLAELRERLAEPAEDAAHENLPARRALRLARAAFEDLPAEHPIYIEGAASLLDESPVPGGLSIGTTRALLQMVEEKHRLVRLLSTCLAGPGLNVVIGREHGTPDLREVAIVSSTYSDGQRVGGVGIIGPVRMRYGRAITLVDSVARAVSRVLRDSNWSEDITPRC